MLEKVISQEASTTNNVDVSNVNPSTDQLTLEEQRLSQKRLEALTRIFDYEITNTKDYLDYALDEVIAVTQSKIGYIYFYDEETGAGQIITFSTDPISEPIEMEINVDKSLAILNTPYEIYNTSTICFSILQIFHR